MSSRTSQNPEWGSSFNYYFTGRKHFSVNSILDKHCGGSLKLAPGKRFIVKTYRQGRRFVRLVVGFTVLIVGIILLLTPGPAFVVIPVGLAILATELVWARRLLNQLKNQAKKLAPRGVNPSKDTQSK